MLSPEIIQQRLQAEFDGCEIEISTEGSHLNVLAVGQVFEGLRPVKRQQLVYAAISDWIADGSVHAVNITAKTPAEVA